MGTRRRSSSFTPSTGHDQDDVSSLLGKLGLRDRAQAVVPAHETGLVTPGA